MSIKNIEVEVSVLCDHGGTRPTKLFGIVELGFNERGTFIVDGYRYPKAWPDGLRGGYLTTLPISPVEYRRAHGPGTDYPVKSGYSLHADRLVIFDDWGKEHIIYGPADVLGVLARDCETHELLNLGLDIDRG
jgi:hypothetical protein